MAFSYKRTLVGFIFASVAKILMPLKVGLLFGSRICASFSAACCLPPLIGKHGDFVTSCAIYCAGALYAMVSTGIPCCSYASLFTVYHVPTLLGIAYASVSCAAGERVKRFEHAKRILLCAICILCIAVFCLHPVGRHACVYTLLWVLPAVTIFLKHNNFFVHALASVCATHALGSVLWLYTHHTTPLFWVGLLPISCVERVLFAFGACALEKAYTFFVSGYRAGFAGLARMCAVRNGLSYISLVILITVCT